MTALLGWIGIFLLTGTVLPFILRRLPLRGAEAAFFSLCHHWLALSGLSVLTLHGLIALAGRRHRGRYGHPDHWDSVLGGDILTGVLSWLVLLAVVILAAQAVRKKPFPRTHCWLVGLLAVMIAIHV